MKKLIVLSLVCFLTGCSIKYNSEQTIPNKRIVLKEGIVKDSITFIKYDETDILSDVLILKEAAYYGSKHGYKYFNIRFSLERDIDPLIIPIRNINEYLIFKGLGKEFGDNYSLHGSLKDVVVYYSNEKEKLRFSWDIKKVIDEEIVIYNNVQDKEKKELFSKKIKETFDGTPVKYSVLEN